MTQLVNLTPHHIVLRGTNDRELVVPPSGQVVRVMNVPGPLLRPADEILPTPIFGADEPGEVVGLPDPAPDTFYIVSSVVADAVGRADVVFPATGPADGAVRNEQGQIVAVTRLKLGRQVGSPLRIHP